MSSYIVTDDDGLPIAVMDPEIIGDHGTRLAFRLAATTDPDDRKAIAAEVLAEVGPDAFGYVAANALQVIAGEILHPVLDCADAAGVHLRPGIAAIAEGRDPMTAGRP